MKNIFALLFAIFAMAPFALYAQAEIEISELMRKRLATENSATTDSVITVTFNHAQTITDLMRIRTWLEIRGITLIYRKLAFDEKGKLDAITFQVMDKDAGGGDSADNLTNDSKVGFSYDYRRYAKYRFKAGNMK